MFKMLHYTPNRYAAYVPIEMIAEILIFVLTTLIGYCIYVHKRIQANFRERGLKFNPGVPVFGNVLRSSFRLAHFLDDINAVYRQFPDEKYVGYIEGTASIILVRDPEIIKQITVKDFDHFLNHKQFITEEVDPLFGGTLLMMRDDKWRDMRTMLSPAFTVSKIRHMMPFMTEISNYIIEYLKDHLSEDIDLCDLMQRYTNDVIASTAFGVQVNSVKDRDNEFFTTGQELFVKSFEKSTTLMLHMYFPKLAKIFGIEMFSEKFMKFFENLIIVTMEHREKYNIVRPDMMQLLLQASKGNLKTEEADKKDDVIVIAERLQKHGAVRKWSQRDLACQLFVFFLAGYESSSIILLMCLHELANKPKVQEKLYEEVKTYNEINGEIAYDNLNELKYLDCVLQETMRKWTPALIMDRVCTKSYELPPPREGGKPVKLEPGDVIYNVVNSIQLDPKYHPEPDLFDPDRFSEERKHEIKPFTFMPFGIGPRVCLGSKFALLEMKVIVYQLILNFKICKCKKTTDPVLLRPHYFNIKAQGGSWVQFESRN